MNREIRHTIEIAASPAVVWAVLTDTSSFSEWNPFMHRAQGELRVGAKLDVKIEAPGSRPVSFRPKVLAVEPERELRWIGRFIMPGLVDGEHSFRLEPTEDGGTRFTQSERLSGLLVRAFSGALDKTQLGFEQMDGALKARAEARR